MNICLKKAIITILLFSTYTSAAMSINLSFQNTLLKEVITDIQKETSYFFLYRESQIAGIRITLESTEEQILEDLQRVLTPHQLTLQIDEARNQVLLIRSPGTEQVGGPVQVSGQVVNATTGERMPYATVYWSDGGEITGAAANASGQFSLVVQRDQPNLDLTASYIGFNERTVQLDLTNQQDLTDLTFRLQPKPVQGQEILVSGFGGYHPSDTLLTDMIDAGRFSPLGESNSIRALQAHPSVSTGTALNNGIHIRGSTPDGFLVQLDNMTLFNQSHLFGLLDSFNDDAIQSSGYHTGVVPAHIDAPTGGTLRLITRTGSRNQYKGKVGISNTAASGTIEGPLGEKSSWLLSTRASTMDHLNWFDNPSLIQWGLDIDRPRQVVSGGPDFTDLVLRPGPSSAQFVDLHGKTYLETSGSGRLMLSGYLGGDRTQHQANRRTRSFEPGSAFTYEEVKTANRWGNGILSIQYEQELRDRLYSYSTAGFSFYETSFDKDDFVYSRITTTGADENISIFTYPFRNRSSMNELKIHQEFEYRRKAFRGHLGGSWIYYRGAYSETSFDRPSYYTASDSHLGVLFLQTDWNPLDVVRLQLGSRLYYDRDGNAFLPAPRLKVDVSPLPDIRLTAGYAVNRQFLHRISLENATTADVWILSSPSQPPAYSKEVSAGIEYAPTPLLYLKLEGYQKTYKQLRLHELNTRSLENTFSNTPWFTENSGEAKGVEVIMRNRLNHFTLTQTYALSTVSLQNPSLYGGESFHPEWDRTHSYHAVLQVSVWQNVQLMFSWIMMSGAPNTLVRSDRDAPGRLDPYYRLDGALTFHHRFGSGSRELEMRLSAFNLLNRNNVWYRNYAFSYEESRSVPLLKPVPIDVLDLGFHPSFSIRYHF